MSFATSAVFRAGSAARFLIEGLLDLALPAGCAGCGSFSDAPRPLCRSCRSRLTAASQADPAAAPAGLNACRAACIYTGDAERWLQAFKYPTAGIAGTDPAPAAVLRALVAEAARAAPGPTPGLVVPVPLFPRRLRERGFNPAAILAHAVARESDAPLSTRTLHRWRDTPSQTGLERRARRRNVAGAFRCEGRVARVVWLVDDVVTTGATLSACARVLRRAGARRIVAIGGARTPFVDGPE